MSNRILVGLLAGLLVGCQQGTKGDTGPQGPSGVPGPVGAQGPAGPTGERGPTGEQGLEGPQGPQGQVVVLSVADGGVLSVDGGLVVVAGPAGPAGPQGQVGPSGATGPEVAAGAQGPALVIAPDGGLRGDGSASNPVRLDGRLGRLVHFADASQDTDYSFQYCGTCMSGNWCAGNPPDTTTYSQNVVITAEAPTLFVVEGTVGSTTYNCPQLSGRAVTASSNPTLEFSNVDGGTCSMVPIVDTWVSTPGNVTASWSGTTRRLYRCGPGDYRLKALARGGCTDTCWSYLLRVGSRSALAVTAYDLP